MLIQDAVKLDHRLTPDVAVDIFFLDYDDRFVLTYLKQRWFHGRYLFCDGV